MGKVAHFLRTYVWFILRNLLGWAMILAAPIAGPIPGPGGIPLLILGFALISFPGKRRFVTRIFRGRPFGVSKAYRWISAGLALALAALADWFWMGRPGVVAWCETHGWSRQLMGGISFGVAFLLLLGIGLVLPQVTNTLVRGLPKARMTIRPILRRMGVRLLPPRWLKHADANRPTLSGRIKRYEDEILAFGDAWRERLGRIGHSARRTWLWIAAAVVAIGAGLVLLVLTRFA